MPHPAGHAAGHPPGRRQCDGWGGSFAEGDVQESATGRHLCPDCMLTLDAEALALLESPQDPVAAAVEYRGLLRWIRKGTGRDT